jgi:hypothetical protein
MTEQALSALLEIQVDTFHPIAKPAHAQAAKSPAKKSKPKKRRK